MTHSPLNRIAHGFTADAGKVTPRQFLDALGLTVDREQYLINLRADTRRAILRGDTRGYPAVLVHEIREEMRAEQAEIDEAMSLAPVVRIAPNAVAV
jgi:hypothetical protein